MNILFNKQKHQFKGFSLMEAMLVLAASAVFIAGSLYLYMSGHSQANVQHQVNFVSRLDTKIKNNYLSLSKNNIQNINTSSLIKNHIISQNKINNNQIYAYIGNHITHVYGTGYNNKVYVLYSTSHINNKQCIQYAKLVSNNFDLVGISHGNIPQSISSLTILQNENNNKNLNPTNLVSQCQSNDNNTITVANNHT